MAGVSAVKNESYIFYFKAQTDMETCPHDVYIFCVKMSDEVDDGSPDSFPAYHVIKLPARLQCNSWCWVVSVHNMMV